MSDWRKKVRKGLLGLVLLVAVLDGELLLARPGTNRQIKINALFSTSVFDAYGIMEQKAVVLAMESLVFITYFNLLFGNYIYNYFRKGSVFTFSRIQNRQKWCWKQAIQLYVICSTFTFVYLVLQLLASMYSTMQVPDVSCIRIFLIFWIAFTVVLMLSTLLINFIAIKFGMVKAFLLTYVLMVTFIELSIHYENIPILQNYYDMHILNPMSAVSLILIKGKILKLIAILYYHFLMIGIVYLGGRFIKKMDIMHIE